MQYHAHALAASSVGVDLVGYEGAPLPRLVTDDPRIRIHRLPEARLRFRAGRSKLVYGALATVDAVRATVRLVAALTRMPRPDLLLVQSPPAMPALHVAWLMARLRRARLVIDWHNLGYSILALRLGRGHVAVRLARWFEKIFARAADAHLCVSRGFARVLAERFGLKDVRVLYDRPAAAFAPIDRVEREHSARPSSSGSDPGCRPVGFVVCPTGWTEDEDFDLVIEAVRHLEDRIRGWEAGDLSRRFPRL